MDRWKYLAIIHRYHLFCNPISAEKIDELVGLLRLPPRPRVLEIACGKGELLCRIVERWDARGVGVELYPGWVAEARAKADERGLRERIEIVEGDGARFEAPLESFGATICLGASWIFGGHAGTISALARWTEPGGIIVVGEPFWKRDPSPEHLRAARLERDSMGTHLGNIEAGAREGVLFLHAIVSSPDDWDRYEGYHRYAAEMYAAENPGDPDLKELLAVTRRYREDAYLRWGREEMGWAVYLFRKPDTSGRM
jgi:SAM-dependent methyltransferase